MLLTILIPTRNRRARVRPLVASLIANLPPARRDQVEIVVLDNRSRDGTPEALRPYESSLVRVIVNEEPQPTSEQNVYNGLHHARGEFVWFLGDDDVPRFDSVAQLIEMLAADAADLFVSNFRAVDGFGRVGNVSQVRGVGADRDLDIVSLIKRVGMVNFFSGWSIMVARRSMLDLAAARRIMEASVIYSHCFWFLKCFASARVRFLARPLVDYRVFHHSQGWEAYTEENNVGYLFYWHLGLLRLYRQAMDEGLLGPKDVSEIYEYRHNGSKYRGIDEIAFKLIEQADFYVKRAVPRDLMSESEFEEASEILLEIDVSIQDLVFQIDEMLAALRTAKGDGAEALQVYPALRAKAIDLLESRRVDLYAPLFVRYLYGYSVYRTAGRWVAFHVTAMSLQDAVFAQFDPRGLPPDVLVEDTEEALLKAMLRVPPRPEPVGARPPPSSMAGEVFDSRQLASGRRPRALGAEGPDSPAGKRLWPPDPVQLGPRQAAALIIGWSYPEEGGVWSVGDVAVLVVTPPEGTTRVNLAFIPYAAPGATRRIRVKAGNQEVSDLERARGERTVVTIDAPTPGRPFRISIHCERCQTPAELLESEDERALGVHLTRIWADPETARRHGTA